ncbi:hypothetical protein HBI60_100650 [Parastagonospora nodorum]|nr:hypothetical protein HBH82_149210 [Parastagonospora nodorum]KAH4683761.1 hypothetical protein HBH78_117130 [Parastagonospora nodorum]KAH4704610.1 hypothetical protein HBH67_098010 [Parastagonospora nodorum]KAH4790720.1 hypothetical protein HBH62_037110 [Parastagonospora nodorum]KAH4794819.1 hypothetical protein HBH63_091160 [Parastagonospora nodorum]
MSANPLPQNIPVTEADLRSLKHLEALLPILIPADENAQVMIGRIQTPRPDNLTAVFEAAVVSKQGRDQKRVMYRGLARGLTREEALQQLIVQIEDDLDKNWKCYSYFGRPVLHGGGSDGGGSGGGSGGGGASNQGEKRRNNSDTDDHARSKKKAKAEDQAEDREGDIIVDEGGEAPGNETKRAIQNVKRRRGIPVMSIAGGAYTPTL